MNLYPILILISCICLILQYPALAQIAAWNATDIHHGEWWRIVSGNFTHTNFNHLAMNIIALWLIHWIFKPQPKTALWVLLLISIMVGCANLTSDLTSYVGLSGVLHGIFAFFTLLEIQQGKKSSWLLLAGLIIKISWEQCYGAPLSTQQLINAPVAIDAHLFGAISGAILASFYYWIRKTKTPPQS